MAPANADSGGASARRVAAPTLREDATTQPSAIRDAEPDPGERIGRYLLLERIGIGGMGVVFAAFDPDLDRRVAVKLLRDRTGDRSADQRLLREARALARLNHPNVVPAFDVGTAAGRTYVAMEYVEGRTLGRWLAERPRTPAEIRRVFVDAGRGLEAAHAIGIVHRDFKPDNVLIGEDGRVRVADFGLARPVPGSASRSSGEDSDAREHDEALDSLPLTRAGVVLGTPAYMAPEQHRGEDVTPATDQFALCVALYEALYGVRPFVGSTVRELVRQKLAGRIEPAPDRGLPTWLRAAIVRGLAPHPADRWPALGDLLALLERGPSRRRWPWALLGGAGLLAVAVAGSGAPEPCGNDDRLATVWNADRRDAAHEAFVATGLGYAEASWSRTEALVDRYAEQWSAMRHENCVAATIDDELAPAELDARTQCLDDRLAALDEVLGVLLDADAALVPLAVTTAAALPPLSDCRAPAARTTARDPSRAAEGQAITRGLTRVSVLENAGRYHAARREGELLLGRADRYGDAELRAMAHQVLGSTLEQIGELDAARRHLLEGVWLGTEAGADIVVANAALDLVWLEGVDLSDASAGLEWARHAAAAIAREGHTQGDAQLAIAIGAVHSHAGRHAEALAQFERARVLFEQLGDSRRVDLATAHQNVGITLGTSGRHAEGRDHLFVALAIHEEVQGPDHPDTANTLDALAGELMHLGELEDSRRRFERALSIRGAALPAGHPNVARSHNNLGSLLEVLGEYDAAEQHFVQAIEAFTAAYGDTSPLLGATMANLGNIQYRRGDHELSRATLQRALRILQIELPVDHPFAQQATAWLARAEVRVGDLAAARSHAAPLVGVCTTAGSDPLICGHARFALALATADDPEAARATATRALADLRAVGVVAQRDAVAVQAWLEGR